MRLNEAKVDGDIRLVTGMWFSLPIKEAVTAIQLLSFLAQVCDSQLICWISHH